MPDAFVNGPREPRVFTHPDHNETRKIFPYEVNGPVGRTVIDYNYVKFPERLAGQRL